MTLRLLAFAASLRRGSINRKLLGPVVEQARAAGAEVDVAEFAEFEMPMFNADVQAASGFPPGAEELARRVRAADGMLIVSPEYNYSLPGTLKNAIDWISRPDPGERHLAVFRGKPAGIVSATPGPHGGSRGLKQLRELLGMIGVAVEDQLGIADSGGAFDGSGRLSRAADIAALDRLASTVAQAAAQGATV